MNNGTDRIMNEYTAEMRTLREMRINISVECAGDKQKLKTRVDDPK